MGFTSVFDIVRLPKSASDPTAQLAMFQSLPDIIVHISYTARCEGGSL